ncbi:alpha/beta hydrolase [Bradymonadaceae bacterium TMQ3]|uniref:Alpha/beta hydrolase n=1 Tax=Lujinxingia sediminis TaxID=2480984 RepID=A0ABY0CXG1_9DELT|nr:alpha/beta hydrolase [Lujinxingia sediminis]RDV39404.1 alpha/beta hydrolase [Bradymonadaceae bacterium TMQ3]RVU48556.1 alpha/beta hydrolase [Lujinxingia sediminis]TXC77850.1 alpha/beta hydrolase [Bradymonadales bacterium TMQ1]
MASLFKSEEARARLVAWHTRFRERIGSTTEAQRLKTSFGETHVLIGGPDGAPALVLLHGALASSAHALRELEGLLTHYRVYAIDIIGQSAMSADVRLAVSDDAYGRWLEEVFDRLELEKALVVGVSWGGFVAIRLAAHAPERIAKLALLVPAGMVKSPISSGWKMGWPMTKFVMAPSEKRLRSFLSRLLTTMDEEWVGYLGEAFTGFNLNMKVPALARVEELQRFNSPVFVLGADGDLSFPGEAVVARASELFQNLQKARVLEGSRHCPPTTEAFRTSLAAELHAFFDGEAS